MGKNHLDLILTDENAVKVAGYIVDRFNDTSDDQMVDYEFDLNKGKMTSNEINTNFKFDTRPDTFLREIKDAICGTEDMTKVDGDNILSFLIKIRDILNTEYQEQIADMVRHRVLNDATKEMFPLTTINIVNVEIGDLPDIDFLIVVQKSSPQGLISGSLSQELMNEHVATGKSLNDIIAEHKATGDKSYQYISGAYKRKYYFEYQIDMFVDYTPSMVSVGK